MEVPMLTRVVVWSIFVLTVAVFCLLRPQAARLFVGGFFGVMGLVVHGLLVITIRRGTSDSLSRHCSLSTGR